MHSKYLVSEDMWLVELGKPFLLGLQKAVALCEAPEGHAGGEGGL